MGSLCPSSSHQDMICRILQQLGLTPEYKGYEYAAYVIWLAMREPELLMQTTKGLYTEAAKHYGTTYSSVECSIRTAVRTVWNKKRPLLEELTGCLLPVCPSASFFLAAVTEYILQNIDDSVCRKIKYFK